MEIELMDDRLSRLYDAGLEGKWLVNLDLIENLDDLLNYRPGGIVRVLDIHNSIKFLPVEGGEVMGCVAGWISDEDEALSSKTDASGVSHG